MLKLHHILWPFLVAAVLLLPGCKRPTYTPRPLTSITPTYSGTQTRNNITVTIAPLSKQESQALFDQRGSRLHSKRKPLHPILITIENNSDITYVFNPQTMDIKLANSQSAARRLYGHTSRRIIAPLLLGSLGATISFFGAAYLVILGTIHQVAMPALVKAGYSLLGISGLIALGSPTISYYQGSGTYEANREIDWDIQEKAIDRPILIAPGTTESFLIFCQNRSLPAKWNIILNEKETQQPLLFNVCVTRGGMPCVI